MNRTSFTSPWRPRHLAVALASALVLFLGAVLVADLSAQAPEKKPADKQRKEEEEAPAKPAKPQRKEEEEHPSKPRKALPKFEDEDTAVKPGKAADRLGTAGPADLATEAKNVRNNKARELFRKLAVPYDEVKFNSGKTDQVEPIPDYVGRDNKKPPSAKRKFKPITQCKRRN